MKALWLVVGLGLAAINCQASEEVVIMVAATRWVGGTYPTLPKVKEVNDLLSQGWRVKLVTSCANGNDIVFVFVLDKA